MRLEPQPIIPRDPEGMHRRLSELLRKMTDQLNGISEHKASAMHTAQSAPPTRGVYAVGDYVPNSAPSKLGVIGMHYVIRGWTRLTNGSNHVLNTDWVQDRALTGD